VSGDEGTRNSSGRRAIDQSCIDAAISSWATSTAIVNTAMSSLAMSSLVGRAFSIHRELSYLMCGAICEAKKFDYDSARLE
jgi:hypothetical protein